MDDREKKQKDNTGEKYIHVSDIPIKKLDQDANFKDNKNNKTTNSNLKDTPQRNADNNETMGIP